VGLGGWDGEAPEGLEAPGCWGVELGGAVCPVEPGERGCASWGYWKEGLGAPKGLEDGVVRGCEHWGGLGSGAGSCL